MKSILCFLGIFVLNLCITHAQDCLPHASEVCKSRTNIWTDDQALCNAIYGNYPGNKANLQKIMEEHFKQSFQFIFMVGSEFKIFSVILIFPKFKDEVFYKINHKCKWGTYLHFLHSESFRRPVICEIGLIKKFKYSDFLFSNINFVRNRKLKKCIIFSH